MLIARGAAGLPTAIVGTGALQEVGLTTIVFRIKECSPEGSPSAFRIPSVKIDTPLRFLSLIVSPSLFLGWPLTSLMTCFLLYQPNFYFALVLSYDLSLLALGLSATMPPASLSLSLSLSPFLPLSPSLPPSFSLSL